MYTFVAQPARTERLPKDDSLLKHKAEAKERERRLDHSARLQTVRTQMEEWVSRRSPSRVFQPRGQRREVFRDWFRVMDADGSGTVEREEILDLCASLHIVITVRVMADMFHSVGKEPETGSLTEPEFLLVMTRFESQFVHHSTHDMDAGEGGNNDGLAQTATAFVAARRATFISGVMDAGRRARTVEEIKRTLADCRAEEQAAGG